MLNRKFWNDCSDGKLQRAVTEYINKDSILATHTSWEKGELLKTMLSLIESVKEPVYREVEKEYLREDVRCKLREWFGKKGEAIYSALPLSELDYLIEVWQELLSVCDSYWESNWTMLENSLKEMPWGETIGEHTLVEIKAYIKYFKEYFGRNANCELLSLNKYLQKFNK